MPPFFTLTRFPNLLIIAFTQYMMRYAIVRPLVHSYSLEIQLNGLTFFCIVFSTVCTAAAGYAINDYFDIKADQINRPREVVVGKTISRRKTMMTHIILCVSGILLGGYATWKAGVPELVMIYIMVAGMLWLYSFTYKRQFLIGNIIVALFSALVPLMVLLDIPPIYKANNQYILNENINLNLAIIWILGVAAFAFLTTLSREIIKDAEDFEGDTAYGCRSLPIVLGDRCTKWSVIGINAVIVGLLVVVYSFFLRQMEFRVFSLLYILLLLIIPVIYISWKVHRAETSNDYRKAGDLLKMVMFAGIAYSGIVWFAMS